MRGIKKQVLVVDGSEVYILNDAFAPLQTEKHEITGRNYSALEVY